MATVLRVNPRMELPHVISSKGATYEFKPDATLPDDLAQALLKTYPDLYSPAKGEPKIGQYRFKDSFKNQTIAQIVDKLDDTQKLRVYEYAKSLASTPTQSGERVPQEQERPKVQVPQVPRVPDSGKKRRK